MRARTLLGTSTVAALALTGLVAVPASAATHPVINEFSASTTGTDVEYIEVLAAPGTDLGGHSLLSVEGDANSTNTIGVVKGAWAAPTLDADGRGLLSLPANALENGTMTLVLVQGTAAVGTDLDATDDGTIDPGAGLTIVDAVAVHDGGAGDVVYGPALGVAYDGLAFAPGGASRIPDGTDTDAAGDWVRNDFDLAGIEGRTGTIAAGEAYNTPGAPNEAFEVEEPPVGTTCESPTVAIGAVQGAGDATPVAGQTVTVRGTVVADLQSGLGGFNLQDAGDGDAGTSDGIFVAGGTVEVVEGDVVTVAGTAAEADGLTEITNPTVVDCGGAALPTPVALTLPLAAPEATESMLVTLTQELTILEYFNFGRFGEVVVGTGADGTGRQMQPTAVAAPGSAEAAAVRAANAANRITIDDGRSASNPDPAIHPGNLQPLTLENRFRGGDTIAGVTGVLDYRESLWRLQPTDAGTFTAKNPRGAAPDIEGATLEVAAFNVLNYFTTLGSRGAVTAEEFDRQEAKIVAAIDELDSAVVGLLEIENNDGVALDTLVAALNEAAGTARWAGIDTGTLGTDAITTALIYQPALVAPEGQHAVLDSSVDPRFDTTRNRPALAQSFRDLATDRILTVAVNHLKSKGSACEGDTGSPEQGNCNAVRTLAADALADWLALDPTGVEADGSLIIGDLNSYDHEDPITTLEEAGFTDLLKAFEGEDAYTYVFDGQLGYLDYGLADEALLPAVVGASAWHANADEPSIFDYTMRFKKDAQDALFSPDPYRASDHDAVVVGIAFDEAPPVETVVETFSGRDRFEANVATSEALFEPGTDVLIASGAVFTDALAAGPAAARAGASLLLTRGDDLPAVTAAELERLQPGSVTVIGGAATVSSAVVAQISEAVPDATVSRVAGADRFETAALVAERFFGTATQAFIASGEQFSDAVSASGVAAAIGDVPVLLTRGVQASEATIDALESLGVESATVVGGRVTVSDATLRAYRDAGLTVERIGGSDRYATNALLVDAFIERSDGQAIAVASGTAFPDALSASMVAGVRGAPVLLALRACVTLDVEDTITRLAPVSVANVGGPASLSPNAWRTGC